MNINFTQKEYRLLLDAVYVADWVLRTQHEERDDQDDPHQMLFQKIYSYASEAGCGGLVDAERDTNRYSPTLEFEQQSGVPERIEAYDEACFWDELIERLAERDVYAELSEDQARGMSDEAYWRRAEPHARRYSREFTTHGLERVKIGEESGDASGSR